MHIVDKIFRHHDGELFEYIKEIRAAGEVIIVKLRGKIDADTIPVIMARRRGQYFDNITDKHILFDVEEVSHVDSATLASLVLLLHGVKLHHRKIAFVNVAPGIRDLVKITRLNKYVHEYENEEEAMTALNESEDEGALVA